MDTFLQQYGWAGFFVYIVWKEVFPFLRDSVFPERMKQEKAERERLRKLEERSAQNDERQAKAFESMSLAVHEMALAISANNERLSTLIVGHSEHARFTLDSISAMRERTAREGQKI